MLSRSQDSGARKRQKTATWLKTLLKETDLAQQKPINWLHLSTLIAVAILVGTEMVGASWAAGWALGGLLQLDPIVSRIIEIGFTLCGFVLLYYFMRIAIRHEPIRH